jgi:endonuclease/exonuclease/phosphatase family metal-dependent hydrolase
MKLISYNIHRGVDRRGRPCLDAIADALADLRPDLLACQEVLRPGSGADQAERLAGRLGLCPLFEPNATTRHGPLGNAILGPAEAVPIGNLDLSVPGSEPRGALRARVGRTLELWNTHLGLSARQRALQWQRLCDHLPAADVALVLCGDFNDWRGGLDRAVRQAGLRSALDARPRPERRTFPAHRPWLALDRVYCRGIAIASAQVLRGAPWNVLSDHLPVEVRFAIPPDEPPAEPSVPC